MMYLDSRSGTRHAAEDRERIYTPRDGWRWEATTLCGRRLVGPASGGCIAPMINCERCRASLRREGWQV